MAKRIASYRGYTVKETTKRDASTFKYFICRPRSNEVEFEFDNMGEICDWIDGQIKDEREEKYSKLILERCGILC